MEGNPPQYFSQATVEAIARNHYKVHGMKMPQQLGDEYDVTNFVPKSWFPVSNPQDGSTTGRSGDGGRRRRRKKTRKKRRKSRRGRKSRRKSKKSRRKTKRKKRRRRRRTRR